MMRYDFDDLVFIRLSLKGRIRNKRLRLTIARFYFNYDGLATS